MLLVLHQCLMLVYVVGSEIVGLVPALAATGPNARLVLKKRIGRGCTAALAEGRP